MAIFDGLIGGALGAVGSVIQGAQNRSAVKDTNRTNLQIARENNQTQIDMQRENNQFNADQSALQWQRETEWNDPAAQKARLLAAGLNPFSDGGQMVDAGSGTSADAASASPSGIQLATPTLQAPQSTLEPLFKNLSLISDAIEKNASAGKTKAETQTIDELRDFQIDQINSEILRNRAETFLSRVQADATKRKLPHEITKLIQEYMTLYTTEQSNRAEQALKALTTQYQEKFNKLFGEQAPLILQQMNEDIKLTKEKQRTEQATQKAQGSLSDMYESQARINVWQNAFNEENEEDIKRKLIADADLSEKQANLICEQARIARREGNWMWFDKTCGRILGVAGAAVMAYALRSPAPLAGQGPYINQGQVWRP